MRKIEQAMLAAIAAKAATSIRNTTIHHADGLTSVYLHGHMIAQIGDLGLHISLAGWNTATTRSRLSAIIRGLADARAKRVHDQPIGDASRATTDDGNAYRYACGLGVSTCKGTVRLHDSRGVTAIDATGWHRVEL